MNKQTKNIITRELIEKELRFYNKAEIRASLLCGGVLALICIPIAVLAVRAIVLHFESMALKLLLGILGGGVLTVPIWIMLFSLRGSLADRKKLLNGDFEITACTLQYKGERVVHKHIEEYFSFGGFDDISVSSTAFYMASVGDDYYIVHYKGSGEIKLLYSAKTHEYKQI